MAELLIKAENPSNNPAKQIGDVVVVKPDGWKWGKEECLPRYVVVKVPDMTVKEAEKYVEPLIKNPDDIEKATVEKYRKYDFKGKVVTDAKQLSASAVSLTKTNVETNIETKKLSIAREM